MRTSCYTVAVCAQPAYTGHFKKGPGAAFQGSVGMGSRASPTTPILGGTHITSVNIKSNKDVLKVKRKFQLAPKRMS